MKGAALIKATLRADVEGFGVSLETEEFCRGSFAALADDINFGNKGSSSCGRKIILPNTQSINGFSYASTWNSQHTPCSQLSLLDVPHGDIPMFDDPFINNDPPLNEPFEDFPFA